MNIMETPMAFEIDRVLEYRGARAEYSYEGEFKIEDSTLEVIKIIGIDYVNDYETAYGPVIILHGVMLLSHFQYIIYPNRDKLEFILKTTRFSNSFDVETEIIYDTYNVLLSPEEQPVHTEGSIDGSIAPDTWDRADLKEFRIQLKPKLLDDVSKVSCGGQFLNTTTSEVVRNAITHHCSLLELDNDEMFRGVDIHHTASETIRESVVIPHGTKLSELADYVQNRAGGIFPTGLAQYLYDKVWYLYPPYDTEHYDDSIDKLNIIIVPTNRFIGINRTYAYNYGVLTVLSTGNKKIESDKVQIQANEGNGVVFSDSSKIVEGSAEDKGNIALLKRSENNSEFVGEVSHDNKNHVPMTPERIVDNPYKVTSRMARAQGHFFSVEWQYADHKLIKPGMNVKIMFSNQNEVCEVNGVLLKSHVYAAMKDKGITSSGYTVTVALNIFVKENNEVGSGLLALT